MQNSRSRRKAGECRGQQAAPRASLTALSKMLAAEPELIQSLLEGGNGPPSAQADFVLRAACQAAAARPKNAELHYYAARGAWLAEQLELAEQLLSQALAVRPRHVPALVLMGKVLHRRRAIERAIACLTSAVSSGAEYPDVYVELGQLWRQTGDAIRARTAFNRALELNPNFKAARDAVAELATTESGC